MPEVLKGNSSVADPADSTEENQLVKKLLLVSVGVHVMFVFFHFSLHSEPEVQEIAIEASLAFDVGSEPVRAAKNDALPGAAKGETLAVDKKILPQLPKKFEIERPQEPTQKIAVEHDEKKRKENKKRAAEKEKQRIKAEALRKLMQENNRLSKKELALRLAKNKLKEEKKVADKTTAPMNTSLEKRLNELANKKKSARADGTGSVVVDAYVAQLNRIIRSNFTLPEIYNYRKIRRQAQVSLRLTSEGEIRKIEVSKSSGDEAFDRQALAAVRVSAPFPPPPSQVVQDVTLINLDTNTKQ